MKITFVANFMNHHQLPFSLKMMELTKNKYTYVAMEPLAEEQEKLGYQNLNLLDFIIRPYEGKEQYDRAKERIIHDDMVIFGSCPDELVELRRDTGKPFIIYSERFFKKGIYRRFIPITMKKIKRRMLQFEGEKVSVICSSAYLPYDLKLMHAKFDTYKWGYFPEHKEYDLQQLFEKKHNNNKMKLLWAGRLIPLKHPEHSIRAAQKLKEDGFDFELLFVGDGILREKLERMVKKTGLENYITFLGAKPAVEVRKYMEEANIFIFNSDYREGWGAVVNESMNSGCAVVASHAVGSVPFLIKNRENGLIYKSGDTNHLYLCVKNLLENPEKADWIGKNAYETITGQWNAGVAACRLYELITAIVENREPVYWEDGPCSIAKTINPYRFGVENDTK